MKKKKYLLFLIVVFLLNTSCSCANNEYLLTQIWKLKPRSLMVNNGNLGKLLLTSSQYKFIQNDSVIEFSKYLLFPEMGTYKILSVNYFNRFYGSIAINKYSKEIPYEKRSKSLIITIDDIEYVFMKVRK